MNTTSTPHATPASLHLQSRQGVTTPGFPSPFAFRTQSLPVFLLPCDCPHVSAAHAASRTNRCRTPHKRHRLPVKKPSSSPPQPHQEKRTCWGTCSNAFHLWNEPMNNGSSIHAPKRDILLHGISKEMFTLFNIYNNLIYRGFIYLGSTVAEK